MFKLLFSTTLIITNLMTFCLFKTLDASENKTVAKQTNTINIELVQVPAGNFEMGSTDGDWDEVPVHRVTISKSFYISKTEVTLEQYRNFRPDYKQQSANGMVTAISWHDAVDFCKWLSEKEGKTYRLPTEAEWEYACKWSDDKVLQGMRDTIPEWCSDWYGFYLAEDQVDPVGPEAAAVGKFKVVRGGKIDDDKHIDLINTLDPHIDAAYYHRPTNRISLPPAFGLPHIENGDIGKHLVGFRIVQSQLPETELYSQMPPFITQGLKQSKISLEQAPQSDKPYFRKRFLLPLPPDNHSREDIVTAGFHESLQWHNHAPSINTCPNGDLLVSYFTAPFLGTGPQYGELAPNVSLIGLRLRYGSDDWDFPEPFLDCADTKDATPLFWTDYNEENGKIYLFWGQNALEKGSYPFQWITSTDNGANWSETSYPVMTGKLGGYSNQPITTAFWDNSKSKFFLSCDAIGPTSLLFASDDNFRTWYDTGGRTKGRHTGFCMLDDGTILGMGGKEGGLNGFLAKSVSSDHGKTYRFLQTEFSQTGGNQRPSFIKLKSGNLFFASDWQTIWGGKPDSITESGSFVALSQDNGESWTVKTLNMPITMPHEDRGPMNFSILGYSDAVQAQNGMIHLITSMNTPCLHFEFNEAWILDPEANKNLKNEAIMPNPAKTISVVKSHKEKFPNGNTKLTWTAGVGDDGRYLLHGAEQWFYEDGTKQYEVLYAKGEKTGTEIYYRPDGSKVWEWAHFADGSGKWNQYWDNGNKKAESNWYRSHIHGTATRWDRTGKLLKTKTWPSLEKLIDDLGY